MPDKIQHDAAAIVSHVVVAASRTSNHDCQAMLPGRAKRLGNLLGSGGPKSVRLGAQ